ncbi:MAG: META domain-containing protein [Verrucomicrobia bacterium]|nr:META domain-containing protein [Verrucomicrobiota bacterium]
MTVAVVAHHQRKTTRHRRLHRQQQRDQQPPDAAEQTVPSGASYTLTFAAGQISTRADCNTCNGAFTVSGQTVTVGSALACTRALCPTAAFADLYVRVLSGESTATVSGATLRLSSTRGVLRFTRG